jgi:hypothetical protein
VNLNDYSIIARREIDYAPSVAEPHNLKAHCSMPMPNVSLEGAAIGLGLEHWALSIEP